MIEIEQTEARVWEVERRTGGPTTYYLLIVDGEKTIPVELIYDPVNKAVSANRYEPGDYDYTVHDGCDHEEGWCVCDSDEYAEKEWMDIKMSLAAKQLRLDMEQIRQQKVAAQLVERKKELSEG